MFADLLPLEHVLIALAAVRLRASLALLAACLLGFALQGAATHEQLRKQQGGRPMFEAERVPNDTQLLFMDTDHGFNLAFGAVADRVVARSRGDAYDRALWEHLGRPQAAVYDFDLDGLRAPRVVPFSPVSDWRFEAESMWPASSVRGGWIEPEYVADVCASKRRVLRLHPTAQQRLELQLELWVPAAGRYRVEVLGSGKIDVAGLETHWSRLDGSCPGWASAESALPPGALRLRVYTREEAVLDAFELVPVP
jgi:hypothetical protein